MAYAFDRVMASIKKPQDEGKSSIFAAQGAAPGASVKRSAEGGEVGAPAGGGGAPATAPQQLPNSGGTKKQAIAKNVGKAQSPVDLAQLKSGISGARGGIKSETDNYLANAAAGQTLGADARGGITALLDPKTAGFKSSAAFPGNPYPGKPGFGEEPLPVPEGGKPVPQPRGGASDFYSPESWATFFGTGAGVPGDLELETNTDFGNANLLRTDAGVGELFRRGGGAEYSGGDAAFDATLLRLDPNFQQERQSTLGALDDLNAEKTRALGGGARDTAGNIAGQARTTAQNEARGIFEGGAASLEAQARERERLYDAALGGGLSPAAQAEADRIMAELAADPELGKYAGTGGAPMAKGYYTSASADDTSWQDFVGEDEGTIFGRIGTALGRDLGPVKGGSLYGKDARENGTFDSEGYAAAVRAAALKGKLGGAVSDSKPGAGDVPKSDYHPVQPGETVTINPEDDPTGMTTDSGEKITISKSDPEAEARVGARPEIEAAGAAEAAGKNPNGNSGTVSGVDYDPNNTAGSGSGTTREGPVPLLTTQPALKSRDAAGQVANGDFAGARDTMNKATENTLAVPGLIGKGVVKGGQKVAAPTDPRAAAKALQKQIEKDMMAGFKNGTIKPPAPKKQKTLAEKKADLAAAKANELASKLPPGVAPPPPPGGGMVPPGLLPPPSVMPSYDPSQDPTLQAALASLRDPGQGAQDLGESVKKFFSKWG